MYLYSLWTLNTALNKKPNHTKHCFVLFDLAIYCVASLLCLLLFLLCLYYADYSIVSLLCLLFLQYYYCAYYFSTMPKIPSVCTVLCLLCLSIHFDNLMYLSDATSKYFTYHTWFFQDSVIWHNFQMFYPKKMFFSRFTLHFLIRIAEFQNGAK